jgi:hypothetical protein
VVRESIVVTSVWCNFCVTEDKHVAGTEAWSVAIDPGEQMRTRGRVVDVCAEHGAMLRMVRSAALVGGLRAAPTDANDGPEVRRSIRKPPDARSCELCGETFTYLIAHVRKSHCDDVAIDIPARCPECGEPYARSGMAPHRTRTHGWDAVADYVALARKMAHERAAQAPTLDTS